MIEKKIKSNDKELIFKTFEERKKDKFILTRSSSQRANIEHSMVVEPMRRRDHQISLFPIATTKFSLSTTPSNTAEQRNNRLFLKEHLQQDRRRRAAMRHWSASNNTASLCQSAVSNRQKRQK